MGLAIISVDWEHAQQCFIEGEEKSWPIRIFHYGPAVCFQGPPGQCVKTTVEILKNNSLDLIPELYLLFRALVNHDLCKHFGPLCSILVDTFSV